jgi:NADPH-dependent curcumin reductase CurA
MFVRRSGPECKPLSSLTTSQDTQRPLDSLQSGSLKAKFQRREHIVVGLENAPSALVELFKGSNTGKMLVQVGDDNDVLPNLL